MGNLTQSGSVVPVLTIVFVIVTLLVVLVFVLGVMMRMGKLQKDSPAVQRLGKAPATFGHSPVPAPSHGAATPQIEKQATAIKADAPPLVFHVDDDVEEEAVAAITAAVAVVMEEASPQIPYAITGITRTVRERPVWANAGLYQNTAPF